MAFDAADPAARAGPAGRRGSGHRAVDHFAGPRSRHRTRAEGARGGARRHDRPSARWRAADAGADPTAQRRPVHGLHAGPPAGTRAARMAVSGAHHVGPFGECGTEGHSGPRRGRARQADRGGDRGRRAPERADRRAARRHPAGADQRGDAWRRADFRVLRGEAIPDRSVRAGPWRRIRRGRDPRRAAGHPRIDHRAHPPPRRHGGDRVEAAMGHRGAHAHADRRGTRRTLRRPCPRSHLRPRHGCRRRCGGR